jgi:hypothetical protein
MVPALTILPLIVPIRMVFGVMFTTSLALGNRKLDLRATIIQSVLIPSGFYIGAHWGFLGLCYAWLISVPLAYSISVPPVMRFIGVRARDFIGECGAPAIASAVMYVTVTALRPALIEQSRFAALGILITAGAIVYVAVMTLISKRHLIRALNLTRSILDRGAANGT